MSALAKPDDATTLLALDSLSVSAPEWPFSTARTAQLIRQGKLKSVRVGRRVFVTRALLADFVVRHTV